ncbi:MAG: prephenate dehydrogenase [Rhodoglobus sp.]
MAELWPQGAVKIVGTGLLGTSIGLALRGHDVVVLLDDASPAALDLAVDYGAGRRCRSDDLPGLVIVCVPPDAVARVAAAELAAYPHALVTDVASVKRAPAEQLSALGADVSRYVGSHPMAGRERGGAISARTDIFIGRPWVVTRHRGTSSDAVRQVEELALTLGAFPVVMTPEAHDRDVALVSHCPQVVASLLARQLRAADDLAVSLAGQGLRDTTRIAASDPELWGQILGANAGPVAEILRTFRDDLDAVLSALEHPKAPGSRGVIAETLASGNAGVARIPGKHGQASRFSQIVVKIDDSPGELARLLTEIGEAGVNMEDLRLEHSPGAQIGLAEISVLPEVEESLIDILAARGWKIAGAFA